MCKSTLDDIESGLRWFERDNLKIVLVKHTDHGHEFWIYHPYSLDNVLEPKAAIYQGSWRDDPKWWDKAEYLTFNGKKQLLARREEMIAEKHAEGFVDFYAECD